MTSLSQALGPLALALALVGCGTGAGAGGAPDPNNASQCPGSVPDEADVCTPVLLTCDYRCSSGSTVSCTCQGRGTSASATGVWVCGDSC